MFNNYNFRVSKAASVASSYWKKKMFPSFNICVLKAADYLSVTTKDVFAECTRRYNSVVDKNARSQ